MASSIVRRPLPALVSLVALLLLTGIVWWRVMNRDDTSGDAAACPKPSASATTGAPAQTLPAPSAITVSVLNATTRTGLAGKVSTTLKAANFKVGAPGNDRTPNTLPAVIRYGPTGAAGARLVQFYFPGSRLVPASSTTATVVVSLGSGFKSVASQAAVTAALKSANLSVRSATPTTAPTTPAPAPTTGASASC